VSAYTLVASFVFYAIKALVDRVGKEEEEEGLDIRAQARRVSIGLAEH
jgi:hypothetical protein